MRSNYTIGLFLYLIVSVFPLQIHGQDGPVKASVLSSGEWCRFAVTETGMRKITFGEIQAAGVRLTDAVSSLIHLYGYGDGLLPGYVSVNVWCGLPEIACRVGDHWDGIFNAGDSVGLHAHRPHTRDLTPATRTFFFMYPVSSIAIYIPTDNENCRNRNSVEKSSKLVIL